VEPAAFWQISCMVQDIEGAMDELGRTLGLRWRGVRTAGPPDAPLRVVLSEQGPPFFELVQGPDGSAWESAGGPRLDHIAYWAQDLAAERERLEGAGAPVVMDGQARGVPANYHALPASGLRVEIVGIGMRAALAAGWGIDIDNLEERGAHGR
jgi:hypothetical protein